MLVASLRGLVPAVAEMKRSSRAAEASVEQEVLRQRRLLEDAGFLRQRPAGERLDRSSRAAAADQGHWTCLRGTECTALHTPADYFMLQQYVSLQNTVCKICAISVLHAEHLCCGGRLS